VQATGNELGYSITDFYMGYDLYNMYDFTNMFIDMKLSQFLFLGSK
jgi:hypothetical protein